MVAKLLMEHLGHLGGSNDLVVMGDDRVQDVVGLNPVPHTRWIIFSDLLVVKIAFLFV